MGRRNHDVQRSHCFRRARPVHGRMTAPVHDEDTWTEIAAPTPIAACQKNQQKSAKCKAECSKLPCTLKSHHDSKFSGPCAEFNLGSYMSDQCCTAQQRCDSKTSCEWKGSCVEYKASDS